MARLLSVSESPLLYLTATSSRERAPRYNLARTPSQEDSMDLARRDLLALGGLTLAASTLAPARARAQTPKRGGTLGVRLWDPPHFDHMLIISYKTNVL